MGSDWLTLSWEDILDPLAALGLEHVDNELPMLARKYCFTLAAVCPVGTTILSKASPGFAYDIVLEKGQQTLRCELRLLREKRNLLEDILEIAETDARLIRLHLQRLGAGPLG